MNCYYGKTLFELIQKFWGGEKTYDLTTSSTEYIFYLGKASNKSCTYTKVYTSGKLQIKNTSFTDKYHWELLVSNETLFKCKSSAVAISATSQLTVEDYGIFSNDPFDTQIFIETEATKESEELATYNTCTVNYTMVADDNPSGKQKEYYYLDVLKGNVKKYFYKNSINLFLYHTDGIYFYYKKSDDTKQIFNYNKDFDYINIKGTVSDQVVLYRDQPVLQNSDTTTVSPPITVTEQWSAGDKKWNQNITITLSSTTYNPKLPWKLCLQYKTNDNWYRIPTCDKEINSVSVTYNLYSLFGQSIFYSYATNYDMRLQYQISIDSASCQNECWHECGHDCTSSCTGGCDKGCSKLCTTDCTGGCKTSCSYVCGSKCTSQCVGSCGDTCSGGCANTCTKSCTKDCSQTCKVICSGQCSSSCNIGCGEQCTINCTDKCTGTCSGTCNTVCNDTCKNNCEDFCKQSCTSTCATGCGDTCTGTCQTTCTTTCHRSCQGTCVYGCQGCTSECQQNAKNIKVI